MFPFFFRLAWSCLARTAVLLSFLPSSLSQIMKTAGNFSTALRRVRRGISGASRQPPGQVGPDADGRGGRVLDPQRKKQEQKFAGRRDVDALCVRPRLTNEGARRHVLCRRSAVRSRRRYSSSSASVGGHMYKYIRPGVPGSAPTMGAFLLFIVYSQAWRSVCAFFLINQEDFSSRCERSTAKEAQRHAVIEYIEGRWYAWIWIDALLESEKCFA